VRRTLELIVNRVFRSRYGLALLLTVVVVSIVGSAQLLDAPADQEAVVLPPPPPPPAAGSPSPSATVDPSAGDDSVASSKAPPEPVTRPGTAKPIDVARAFAQAWLHHRDVTAEEWHASLLPHSTPDLSEKLADTDPAGVPADRITGELALIPHGKAFVEVTVPVDAGQLRLRLIAPEGQWLVDGVDWVRS
jgi:hypothetical protein